MCGIFGTIGAEDPLQTCIAGLELLEYRGYDSTGIAGILEGKIAACKEIGKLVKLKQKLTLKSLDLAIGHTRWATHGKVTHPNAHPHLDEKETLAVVHNGIIENCDSLKEHLQGKGISFQSETDTEVIAQLVAHHYQGDLVAAVRKALPLLKGHFAIALIHKNHPDQIIAAAKESPLCIGWNDLLSEAVISSDPNTFWNGAWSVIFLRNGEIAKVQKGKVEIFDEGGQQVVKKPERLEQNRKPPSKEGFSHFLLKEIYEQPSTVQKAFLGRFEESEVQFESFPKGLGRIPAVCFIGCGTSAHAGMIGALLIEEFAQIPARCEIASEARYRIIPQGTLVIALSQSGETADTISAVREMKGRGLRVIGICNVKNSTLTRETDGCISLKAGPEISVCSSKAFTSQMTILYLLALHLAQKGTIDELKKIPSQIEQVLNQAPHIEQIAKKYSSFTDFFFMGRHYMFPTCLEAALKLKEISYVNANGYPAGELKHGPIALIGPHFPVIAFCANHKTETKILSNLQEVKARGAPILALAPEHLTSVAKLANDILWLPSASDPLSPFASIVAGQLFAYYIAKEKGCDIDQPRHLAKSVTVE